MKYAFCPFNISSCMSSDPLIPASVMNVKQVLFTPPGQFNLNSYCYWVIKPPSEFTADIVLKVTIDILSGTSCYLNFGGSITTASSERSCQ